jgi:hypothetical protein
VRRPPAQGTVTDTGTVLDRTWAQQATDALLALGEAAEAARQAGKSALGPEARKKHEDWYRQAAETGIAVNAARKGKLQQKRHALATRMKNRGDDYLRFPRDLRVPFTRLDDRRRMRQRPNAFLLRHGRIWSGGKKRTIAHRLLPVGDLRSRPLRAFLRRIFLSRPISPAIQGKTCRHRKIFHDLFELPG